MQLSALLPKRLGADLALLGIAGIWGATFPMVKDAASNYPVLAFLAVRFSLAALALLVTLVVGARWPSRAEIVWGMLAGIPYCLGYIFQTFALKLIESGRTGFLTGLYVVMVPILALILLRHPLKIRVILGVVLAVVGLTLLSYAPGGNLTGDIMALLGALCFGLQIIAVERFPRNADWRMMALVQCICVAGISFLFFSAQLVLHACDSSVCTSLMSFAEVMPTTIPLDVIGTAAFTGLLATALGLGVQVWAQRRLPPSDAAIIFALEAPFSALFGFFVLHEVLSVVEFIGCGLMLSGMLVTSLNADESEKIAIEVHEH